MNKNQISKGVNVASTVVDAIKPITDFFFPKISGSVALASTLLDKLSLIDSDIAKTHVIGLSGTSSLLDNIRDEYVKTGKVDVKRFDECIDNIKSIDKSLDKFYKIIS